MGDIRGRDGRRRPAGVVAEPSWRMVIGKYYRRLLVWLQLPMLYQRVVVWWEFHAPLRERLKALRMFAMQRSIAMRNNVFGSAMIVARRQIQHRNELRHMSAHQIMVAYRSGRLDYMMSANTSGIGGYGAREWANSGGQERGNVRKWQ
jgi:hypothetical protein